MSSSLQLQADEPGISSSTAPWWSAASPVAGDVVLSGAVLLFVAVAFAFAVYHYFFAFGRRGAAAGGVASGGLQPRGAAVRAGGDGAASATASTGGLDPAAVLRTLPVTVYYGAKAAEALECAVCLAELADGEAARFLPRCGHGFHAECVDPWLRGHPTCPLCRVGVVDEAAPLPAPPSTLPPTLPPEPANYPASLPTDVLFWGSQDAVATTRTAGGGPIASGGARPVVIEVREETAAAAPPPPREGGEGGEAKSSQGLARLSSLRRLWNRGTRHGAAAATSSGSCRRAATAGAGTEREPAPAWTLDIWNL